MTILLRVSLDIEESHPEESLRFRNSVRTIKAFSKKGNKLVILAHLGRPKVYEKKLSLIKFKKPLERSLNKKVVFLAGENISGDARAIKLSKPGTVFLMENVRFNSGETTNSSVFARSLAGLGERYVNDDFPTVHHTNASNVGITKFIPSSAGPNLKKEISILSGLMRNPKKPFILIIGGVKMSDKMEVIYNLLIKADFVILGGGPGNTFIKANGLNIGQSIYEPRMLPDAKKLSKNERVVIPIDSVWSKNKILDIGPATIKNYTSIISTAKTIIWGGPMGFFENPKFSKGTKSIWQAIIKNKKSVTVVGGGETVASLKLVSKNLKADKNIYLSTGGGAMLEFLAGKKLLALIALKLQKK